MNYSRARGRKNVKKGVSFTLMVVGASGTGRTTFVNTLCGKQVLEHKYSDDAENAHISQPVVIKAHQVELEEEGARIGLTIVDTPGFGDALDNESSFAEIVSYLERQYDDILSEESRINRNPRFRDNRVHACLYFITPTGHGLRELDVEMMRRLSPRVNVIPVIGKADSLTPEELAETKKLIMEDIDFHKIPIYNFPYDIEEDDEDTVEENAELRGLLPFAIVGSEDVIEVGGRRIRARVYPWGHINIDDPRHSDFLPLRSALLSTHLGDLKEITTFLLYENYRTESLSRGTSNTNGGSHNGNSEQLATQAVRVKEEQLRREEEKLRDIEFKVQREIAEKRQQLLAKEEALKSLEQRLAQSNSNGELTT